MNSSSDALKRRVVILEQVLPRKERDHDRHHDDCHLQEEEQQRRKMVELRAENERHQQAHRSTEEVIDTHHNHPHDSVDNH